MPSFLCPLPLSWGRCLPGVGVRSDRPDRRSLPRPCCWCSPELLVVLVPSPAIAVQLLPGGDAWQRSFFTLKESRLSAGSLVNVVLSSSFHNIVVTCIRFVLKCFFVLSLHLLLFFVAVLRVALWMLADLVAFSSFSPRSYFMYFFFLINFC